MLWINAIAFRRAKLKLILVARVAATITFVVFAPAVVVATVANTVTHPVRVGAFAEAHILFGCVSRVVWI